MKNLIRGGSKGIAFLMALMMVGSVFGAVSWAPTAKADVTTKTYYLNCKGTTYTKTMEDTASGENDGRGYNHLGAVFVDAYFVGDIFGVPHVLGDIIDEYPASPAASGFTLDTARDVEATVYVTTESYNDLLLNISLYAFTESDAVFLGGASVENIATIAGSPDSPALFGYVPFEAKFKVKQSSFTGNLKLVIKPELATGDWFYGYEGDHASFVKIPIQSTASQPPTASFTYTIYPDSNKVDVDATGSTGGSGTITKYEWQW
ncbi:MAG: hypothetical protein CVT47_00070, partial [Thermoplasmata archaeon HGW-Thermoplasmata-2]